MRLIMLFFLCAGLIISCSAIPLTINTPLTNALAAINALPEGKTINDVGPTTVAYNDLKTLLGAVVEQWRKVRVDKNVWLDQNRPDDVRPYFLQKMTVPVDVRRAIVGDLRGNVHALCFVLGSLQKDQLIDNNWSLANNARIILLGDYTGVGPYGIEVWYLISRLKLANPDRVVVLRGCYEDKGAGAQQEFMQELNKRYANPTAFAGIKQLLDWTYAMLPSALFVGVNAGSYVNYVQYCHGGVEFGCLPGALLAGTRTYQAVPVLYRANNLARLGLRSGPGSVDRIADKKSDIGFVCGRFALPGASAAPQRSALYSEALTKKILTASSGPGYKLEAIYRGYQYDDALLPELRRQNGITSYWNGMVTMVVSCLRLPPMGGDLYRDSFIFATTQAHHVKQAHKIVVAARGPGAPAAAKPPVHAVPARSYPRPSVTSLRADLNRSKAHSSQLLEKRRTLAQQLRAVDAQMAQTRRVAVGAKPGTAGQIAARKNIAGLIKRKSRLNQAYRQLLASYKKDLQTQRQLRRLIGAFAPGSR